MSRDLLVVACAVSAGIHAALVPAHFGQATAAGLGFLLSAVVLAGLAAALSRSAAGRLVDAAIVVLGGLIGAYALATTTGIPVLHPDPERLDRLALATKAVEALGLFAALNLKGTLSWPERTRTARFLSR